MERNEINGHPVPSWVITGSYVLGWVFGGLILLRAIFGLVEHNGVLVGAGIYLILFPLIRESPDTVMRRLFGGGA